jgi:tight adherence protein B
MLAPAVIPIAIFLLTTVGVGGLLLAAFYPRLGGASQTDKRFEVMAASLKPASRARGLVEETPRKRSVEETLRELEEKDKARAKKKGKASLLIRMRQAGLSWNKRTYFLVCIVTGAVVFVLVVSAFGIGRIPAFGFGLAGGLLLPHVYVNFKRRGSFKRFANAFPNALDVIVRGVKAGLPLTQCLKIVAAEVQEPVKREFQAIIEDQTLGVPLDEAVRRLAERVPLPEVNIFAIVLAIQCRTGGSLSGALSNLVNVLRERKKMQEKIKALSSEAKASAGIIGVLPIAVGLLVYLTTPNYIRPLFTTTVGNFVIGVCGFWMLMGVLVMGKMIRFDF